MSDKILEYCEIGIREIKFYEVVWCHMFSSMTLDAPVIQYVCPSSLTRSLILWSPVDLLCSHVRRVRHLSSARWVTCLAFSEISEIWIVCLATWKRASHSVVVSWNSCGWRRRVCEQMKIDLTTCRLVHSQRKVIHRPSLNGACHDIKAISAIKPDVQRSWESYHDLT